MQAVAQIISFLVSIYSFLIVIRILFTWVSLGGDQFGGLYQTLCTLTDPVLNIFRNISGLRRGSIDFSPLAALVTLGILNSIFATIARQGRITLGIILAIILQGIWSVASFFLLRFIVLLAVRLVMDFSKSPSATQYRPLLDSLTKWPIDIAHSLFFSGKSISIRQGIYGGLLLTIGTRFIGGILMNWLIRLLMNLPI
mgnify:CR=1 FL=1